MLKFYAILLVCVLRISSADEVNDKKVVCYFYSESSTKPESLNASLCTHINYAFVQLDENGTLESSSKTIDITQGMYHRVYMLKQENPKLKLLFSVVASSASVFSTVAASEEKRKTFIDSSIDYIKTYRYDGIDIDWEFPTVDDKENFVTLLKEMKTQFAPNNWLVTAAVRPIPTSAYNAIEIIKYVDFLNIMCYNYYGPWSAYTGQNSPLYPSSVESSYERKYLNVAESGNNWLAAGATRDKIVIGLPFYGRSFTLKDPAKHDFHSPITGKGKVPTPTYAVICNNYNNWTTVWDDEQKNYYKYLDDQWLGYDEERSLTEKVRYIMKENFTGVMVWHLGGDDVLGVCGKPQVLLNLLKTEINKPSSNSSNHAPTR